ncbi:MAG: hypothetical protein ACYTE8_09830 [Planctomycetota bacterium]|jgi:hypothetical protein
MACAVNEVKQEGVKVEPDIKQVSLFKNGLGFFISEVRCPDEKEFSFVPCAAATHGTLWVSYPEGVELESLVGKEVEIEKPMEAITMLELLKANVGKEVTLALDVKEEATIRGRLKSFAEERPRPEPRPYSPGMGDNRRAGGGYMMPSAQGSLVIIESEGEEAAVDSHSIRRVTFNGGTVKSSFSAKSKAYQLEVKLSKAAGGKKLGLSYLAKGITWAPSYILDISETDELKLSAKAVVINEVCELEGVKLELVTGFPNLKFADVMSPLAKKENLALFLNALSSGQSRVDEMGGVLSNVMTQQRAFRGGGMMGGMGGGGYMMEDSFMPGYGAAEAGTAAEDLFLYPVEDVHLGKGETGYLPLFTESVPYKHIYKWDIPDYVSEEERYSNQRRGQDERERVEEVWHCLRLENTTKVPWTTAPTPTKGETTVKITQAVSVKAEQSELETERIRDAAQLYGYHYDLVTLEGQLSVTNFQDKSIRLEITKILSGEMQFSEPEVKIESLARGLRRMNGVKKLTWIIELKAGESKELGYTVRR